MNKYSLRLPVLCQPPFFQGDPVRGAFFHLLVFAEERASSSTCARSAVRRSIKIRCIRLCIYLGMHPYVDAHLNSKLPCTAPGRRSRPCRCTRTSARSRRSTPPRRRTSRSWLCTSRPRKSSSVAVEALWADSSRSRRPPADRRSRFRRRRRTRRTAGSLRLTSRPAIDTIEPLTIVNA